MNIDERIKAFSDAVSAQLAGIGTNVSAVAANVQNIASDEAGLLEQIKTLSGAADLSPEAQAALAGILDSATTMAGNSATVAANAKTLADSIPDVVQPPPPPPPGGPTA